MTHATVVTTLVAAVLFACGADSAPQPPPHWRGANNAINAPVATAFARLNIRKERGGLAAVRSGANVLEPIVLSQGELFSDVQVLFARPFPSPEHACIVQADNEIAVFLIGESTEGSTNLRVRWPPGTVETNVTLLCHGVE